MGLINKYPFRTDSTGGTGTIYTPSMVGTYTLQTHFPGQWYNWTRPPAFSTNIYGNIWYEASDSEILELVVTEEQREYYPQTQYPTEYWSRPIDAQHREWATISANWLTTLPNQVAPNNDDAPETAHILWTNPMQMGGLAGGATGNHAFECGDAYEGLFTGSVIIGGVLFYNHYKSGFPTQQVVAVDLHTGEELWSKSLLDPEGNSLRLSFGQTFYWDSYNYHAVFPYLWCTSGSTWHAFDPFDGQWVYSMENVPSGTNLYAAERGIEWNVTIPTGLPGSITAQWFGDRIVGCDAPGYLTMGDLPIHTWAISVSPGHEGALIFNTTWNPPPGDLTISWGTRYSGAPSIEEKVYTLWSKDTQQHYGFSLDTGQQIWGPTDPQPYLDYLGIANIIDGGILFSARMAGVVNAYNVSTGEHLWTYEVSDPYTEILWSDNWPVRPLFITDGKIYYGHSEHSPVDPKPRGAPFVCLNVTNGEEIWRIDGAFRVTDWGGLSVIGDSIIATYNSYDQRVYAIGKGPSAISVETPLNVIPKGDSITIEGRITDISPGTRSDPILMRFPNGVPVVSDVVMSEWMKYVYIQFPMPSNVEGVEVILEAVDPAGNYFVIDKVMSDGAGMFKKMWKPETEGEYTIIARFAGSKSYWPSYAESALSVGAARDPYPTYPGYQGPSSSEIANSVVASMPADASPQEVAQAVVNAMPEYPEQQEVTIPEYTTMDIILAILVAIAIVIGLVLLFRKK
ncbi:MAG: PQQ-binding-like beta-propeller repeat protein [Candidatus Bathyarchaeota archaeon]